jgi:hypothetical protein
VGREQGECGERPLRRVGAPACGRIGVMSGSRLRCEQLTGLVLIPGAATDGIRLLPQARDYDATGLYGTDAIYGAGSPRPRRTAAHARQHKAQAVERAFPRPRDEAVVSKADGRGRAAFNCALGCVKRRTSPIEP